MQRFELTIRTKPIPWKAPYVGRKGAFSDAKLKAYQNHVKMLARLEWGCRPPHEGLVILTADFYFQRPARRPTDYPPELPWGKDVKKAWKHTRPDRTNLLKALEDPLEGVVYFDDRQVVDGPARKYFCDHGDDPRIEIVVEEV